MKRPILKSMIPPAVVAAVWFLDSNDLISFSEPVGLFLSGLLLIGLANIFRNKFKGN